MNLLESFSLMIFEFVCFLKYEFELFFLTYFGQFLKKCYLEFA